jgi:hypothetical protein
VFVTRQGGIRLCLWERTTLVADAQLVDANSWLTCLAGATPHANAPALVVYGQGEDVTPFSKQKDGRKAIEDEHT